MLGDNGAVTRSGSPSPLTTYRVTVPRSITPYDLGDAPMATASGPDTITGDADNDVLLGQAGNDRVDGGTEADYAEGGQDADLVLGGDGDDDVAGGSSARSRAVRDRTVSPTAPTTSTAAPARTSSSVTTAC